ncbi:MAG: hypothetical protein AAF597_20780, partial [Bacteroidota bacterium]
DIWQELYQFPLVETVEDGVAVDQLAIHPNWPEWLPAGALTFERSSKPYRQQLTHQTIIAVFHRFRLAEKQTGKIAAQFVSNKKLNHLAFPRVITRSLEDKSLLLDLF